MLLPNVIRSVLEVLQYKLSNPNLLVVVELNSFLIDGKRFCLYKNQFKVEPANRETFNASLYG